MKEYGKQFKNIIQHLGYEFVDHKLLNLAVTHSSYDKINNNQRLEFLGDAILNLVIAEYLYHEAKSADEGNLTRIRSNLVKKDTLAAIAKNYCINDAIVVGAGELKTAGRNKNSILADTLEALIAAIYLDSNFATVKKIVIKWYKKMKYFSNIVADDTMASNFKDAKTILQELLHAKGLELPVYSIIQITGKPHKQQFTINCEICLGVKKVSAIGLGTNRKQAEQEAANKILKLL